MSDFPIDLRAMSRRSDSLRTEVWLHPVLRYASYDSNLAPWIVAGEADIGRFRHEYEEHILRIYHKDATDREHDSAFVVRMAVRHLRFDGTYHGWSSFVGMLPPHSDAEDIRVPMPGWAPTLVEHCKRECCGAPHPVVEEYVPPELSEEELAKLAGRYITIRIGPAT